MSRMLAAFLSGLVFGVGLVVAQMTNPAKVIGFLNITGQWDPSLMLVMAGGLVVFGAAYALTKSRAVPRYAPAFVLPSEKVITHPLIAGAALFGTGWALAGLCPGPAVVSAAFGEPRAWAFIVAMLAGMQSHHILTHAPTNQEDAAAAAD
jgi:uncharacterized protein